MLFRSLEVMVSCILVMFGGRSVMLRTFVSLHTGLLCNLSLGAATFHRLCNRLVTDFRQSDDRPSERARSSEINRSHHWDIGQTWANVRV